jgi:hypothetical protein
MSVPGAEPREPAADDYDAQLEAMIDAGSPLGCLIKSLHIATEMFGGDIQSRGRETFVRGGARAFVEATDDKTKAAQLAKTIGRPQLAGCLIDKVVAGRAFDSLSELHTERFGGSGNDEAFMHFCAEVDTYHLRSSLTFACYQQLQLDSQ